MADSCDFEFMEYIDEESIDMNLICSICHKPLKDPVSTPCDHTYGRECITHWLTQGIRYSCPTCNKQPLLLKDLSSVGRLLRNILDQLRVRCTLCDQTGLQRGNFVDHINNVCPNAKVACRAADIKCPWKGLRGQLDEHTSVCVFEPLRPVLATLIGENQKLTEQVRQHDQKIEKLTAKLSQMNTTTTATADSDDDADSVVSGADDNFGQDGDSIFVRNLPNGVRFHEVFDLFAKVGQIKYNPRSKKPGVHIFRNITKKTPFCNAKVTFVNKESVATAIAEYNHKQIPQWNTKILVTKFLPDLKTNAARTGPKENVGTCQGAEAASSCETMTNENQPSSEPNASAAPKKNRGPRQRPPNPGDKSMN